MLFLNILLLSPEIYHKFTLFLNFWFISFKWLFFFFLNRWRLFFQQCSVLWKWSHPSYLWSALLLCCGFGLPKFYFSSLPYIPTTRGKFIIFFWVSFKGNMLEVNIFIAERNNVYFHKEFIKIQNVINTVKKKKKGRTFQPSSFYSLLQGQWNTGVLGKGGVFWASVEGI